MCAHGRDVADTIHLCALRVWTACLQRADDGASDDEDDAQSADDKDDRKTHDDVVRKVSSAAQRSIAADAET